MSTEFLIKKLEELIREAEEVRSLEDNPESFRAIYTEGLITGYKEGLLLLYTGGRN